MKNVIALATVLGIVALTFAIQAVSAHNARAAQARLADDNRATADALTIHGISPSRVYLPVLARAGWSETDTLATLAAARGDVHVATQVLGGITHALCLGQIAYPDRAARLDLDGVLAWVRMGLFMLTDGVSRHDLATHVEQAVNTFDADLPLRYTAWAFAAGLTRDEALVRWRVAQINMDEVRRAARDNGHDLSAQPSATAA